MSLPWKTRYPIPHSSCHSASHNDELCSVEMFPSRLHIGRSDSWSWGYIKRMCRRQSRASSPVAGVRKVKTVMRSSRPTLTNSTDSSPRLHAEDRKGARPQNCEGEQATANVSLRKCGADSHGVSCPMPVTDSVL